jgi:hypothetical protein
MQGPIAVCETVISGRHMRKLLDPVTRGLFGTNDLKAAHSKSVSSFRMILGPFGRLNHVQTDAFNRQTLTTGISEITP